MFNSVRALEDVLSTAKRWAIEESRALLEIQEKKLFKVTDFTTFESYAVTKWGYDRSTIYRLTQWARAIRTLSPIGDYPQRESVSRPLHGLDPADQLRAWKAVTKNNPQPTAADVQSAVDNLPTRQKPVTGAPQGRGEVVRGDAAKMLATLPDQSISLLLTSPPFCEQRKRDFPSIPEERFPAWFTSVMESARPKMQTDGSVIIEIREHIRNGEISDYLLRTRLAIRAAGWARTRCAD